MGFQNADKGGGGGGLSLVDVSKNTEILAICFQIKRAYHYA